MGNNQLNYYSHKELLVYMKLFDSKKRALRRIVSLFNRRYSRILLRSSRLYYVKKARSVDIIIEYRKDLVKTRALAQRTKGIIKKQKNLILNAEAEINSFINKDKMRLISFLRKIGAINLIPYIEKHGNILNGLAGFFTQHNVISLLDLEVKFLNEEDYKGFEEVFLTELKLYKQLNNVIQRDFEIVKGFFEYQYSQNTVAEEVKPVFNQSLNELAKWEKTKTNFPPVSRIYALMMFFLIFLMTVMPGQVGSNLLKEASSKERLHHLIKEHPNKTKEFVEFSQMISESKEEIKKIQADETLTEEEKAEFIEDYRWLIEQSEEAIELVGEVERLSNYAKNTIAQTDVLLEQTQDQMDILDAKIRVAEDLKAKEGIKDFEAILRE